MKDFIRLLLFSLLLNTTFGAEKKVQNEEARATYQDIEKTLGSVPTFLKTFPEEAIAGAWADMKALQLNNKTALSGKDKELIGLAVAAQIPCKYCTYFHTQAAKLNKATVKELHEAVALAALVRRWSTIIHGNEIDFDRFKNETDRMIKNVRSKQGQEAMEAPAKKVTNAQEAYADMNSEIGFLPGFLQKYPDGALAGAWSELKALEMNPNTALPGKTKELIGLAVAAQVPCPYCVYYYSAMAISMGATLNEIRESVAMAGLTRHWSTVLNGMVLDEKQFEKETDRVMKHLKAKG